MSKMRTLILLYVYFLDAVHGAAHPAPTPAARLEDRQSPDIVTLWTPVTNNSQVSYSVYTYSDSYIAITSGSFWDWCPTGPDCVLGTSCQSGTLYYSGSTIPCAPSYSSCDIESLFPSTGADHALTRPVCQRPGAPSVRSFFVTSPGAHPITVTTAPTPTPTSQPTSTTTSSASASSPAPVSKPTPIGAIVGGVIGGLALIAFAATAIVFLVRRRKQTAVRQPIGAPQVVQHGSQPSTYDSKHAALLNNYPGTPGSPSPPLYGNPTGQNWTSYPLYGVALNEAPANAVNHDLTASTTGAGTYLAPDQPHYGNVNAVTQGGPFEMRAHSGPMTDAVEMNAHQSRQ